MPEEKIELKSQQETPQASSWVPRFIFVVIIALVSSIGGGLVSWFLISRTITRAEAKATDGEKKVDAVAEALEKGGAVALDPFVVNLTDVEAARYLRIKISLMFDERTRIKNVSDNSALQLKTRDLIIQILTEKNSNDLINEEGKKRLRDEVFRKIAPYFKRPKLVDVMFTEFVIQL